MAHAVGVSVEGELGCLGSLETGEAGEEDGVGAEGKLTREQLLTDPEQAADFVAQTRVDALAIAIGTSHGAYKFTTQADRRHPRDRPHQGDPRAHARHAPRDARLLVSVPQEWLKVIREHGGEIKETYGVPVEEIQRGHPPRRAQGQHRHRHPPGDDRRDAPRMATDPSEFDPRKFLKDATAAARDLCKARFEAFGCAGQAPRIKPVPLAGIWRRASALNEAIRAFRATTARFA